jgi:uncharacterized protein YndB with AHSA1/START domain
MPKNKLSYSYEIYIGAPASRVWKGLVDGNLTKEYVYGTRFQGKLAKGEKYAFVGDGDFKVVDGTILEIDPEKKLAITWKAHWDDAVAGDRASRVTYEISSTNAATTKLRVTHDDFDAETATYKGSVDGWPLMLSSLKTLLESGKPLASA